jgi:DNA ligase-1
MVYRGYIMKFSHVASTFDQIENVQGRLEITRLLADLLAQATPQEASIICNLSLGQLNPPHIGTQFNIAQKNMIKIVATVLDISESAATQKVKKEGDVGLVLTKGTAWPYDGALTVAQVYAQLTAIESMSGTGSQEEKAARVCELLEQLDAASAKFVVRIIVGKLRLGFSDMTIVDALSWMEVGDKSLRDTVENAYNVCADIGFIAQELKQRGIKALEHMHIQVGTPIRPAAAERLPTARAIFEKIGDCVAQLKLDGFRLQIHIDKTGKTPQIHFYSRNLLDMSAMFPDVVAALQDFPVKTMICEGEAISYDVNTQSFLSFQETVKRKRKHDIEQAVTEFPLKVFLFDLLYLNGTEMLDLTHVQRRDQLKALFARYENPLISVVEEKPIYDAQELELYFKDTIAKGLEGLVVKRLDAPYKPGKRNFNWIKLKRQEEGHLEDTLDCVVLGYYAGAGKRAQFGIGAFLVGVYNKKNDCFETVAKVGTGLTDGEWKVLKKQCDAQKVVKQPINVICAKELMPDVWVAPEIVCMIRADEITQSPAHTAGKTEKSLGYALRFPRFMEYRTDKGPFEATTTAEIIRLYQDQFVEMNAG